METHTLATLPVSVATFEEIFKKLVDVGYQNARQVGHIDMNGLRLIRKIESKKVELPRIVRQYIILNNRDYALGASAVNQKIVNCRNKAYRIAADEGYKHYSEIMFYNRYYFHYEDRPVREVAPNSWEDVAPAPCIFVCEIREEKA